MNRLIAWFAHNPIAANILMVLIAVAGLTSIPGIDKEFFPQAKIDTVVVSVPYPGAGPAEVEQQICMRIEEAVDRVDGIKRMTSTASEGLGVVTVEIEDGFETLSVLNEIKTEVDSITTFPSDSETPQVTQSLWRSRIISIGLAGDIGEAALKELALSLKDELTALPDVQLVEMWGEREYELSIEIDESDLRRYGLRFSDVAAAVRAQSLNLPAGKLQGFDGDLQLQTRSQAYEAEDFNDITVLQKADGTRVALSDVATVKDGFREVNVASRFNDRPAISLEVSISQRPNIMATSHAVQDYVESVRDRMPPGVEIETWRDMNVDFEGRVQTLLKNGLGGLVLVFILLLLFLRPLLAMWVAIGIGVAFLGSFWLLPYTGTTINVISLFSFILILGIVVDDAIIVGESVYGQQKNNPDSVQAAVDGATQVLKPVFFAVLTTMIVFASFYALPADQPEPKHMAGVVLLALIFSLIECLLILPSHLAHMKPDVPSTFPVLKQLDQLRENLAIGLENFVHTRFKPVLVWCLEWRWLTLVSFTLILILSASLYTGGWILRSFGPIIQADFLLANVEVYEGTPFHEMRRHLDRLESTAGEMRDELNSGETPFVGHIEAVTYGQNVRVVIELINYDRLPHTNLELITRWRDKIGTVAGIKEFDTQHELLDFGKPIQFDISADDLPTLEAASQDMLQRLRRYSELFNVRSSLDNPRPELVFKLKPQAHTLGLNEADLAQQVRQAFYGEEIQRIPRMREDVRVMVRYPLEDRRYTDSILNMYVRAPNGVEVPFETVADIEYRDGYTRIARIDRRRAANVSADLVEGAQAFLLLERFFQNDAPELKAKYPGLSLKLEGEQDSAKEFEESINSLLVATMIIIFGIMAVVFHSYWQPLLIVTAIPFGLVGAVWGHVLIGREISMFSLIGVLACAGVVVNDNLVLIDRINRYREEGIELWDSIVNGATDRFRAIILTSVTTFVGLMPIMSERSVQSQFLIPMVASLAFGVLFATFVTLLFTPALYLAGESVRAKLLRLKFWGEAQ